MGGAGMRRILGLIVVVIALAAWGGPAEAGRAFFPDPPDDTVECNTGDPLEGRGAGDVLGVRLRYHDADRSSGAVEVQISDQARAAVEELFSWAVRLQVRFQGDEARIRAFLNQVHDGERTTGEVDPATNEPVESDAETTIDGDLIVFDLGTDVVDVSGVMLQAFSMPVEGDPTSCDDTPEITRRQLDELATGDAADDDSTPIGDDDGTEIPAEDGADEATESAGGDGGGSALVWWILGGVVLAMVAVGFWLWWSNRRPDEPDEPDSIVDELSPPEVL